VAAEPVSSKPLADEEVVVTATRLPRPGDRSVYPSLSVTGEEIDRRGITTILDALNTLPSTGLGATPAGVQSSQGVGSAFVNMFDLGTQRTLTLVDGRRFIGGNQSTLFGQTGTGLQVDLNTLPTALIERIEVVSVGGAPTYGADAIAGVVNVVLKRDYEGTEFDSQSGAYESGTGPSWRLRGSIGRNFDDGRGNITLTAEHSDIEGFTYTSGSLLNDLYALAPNPLNGPPFTTSPDPNGVFNNILIADYRLPPLTSGGAIFRNGLPPTYLTSAGRIWLAANPSADPAFALVNTSLSPFVTRLATVAEIAAGARPPENDPFGAPRVAVPLLFNPDGTIGRMNVGLIAAGQPLNITFASGGDGLDLAPLSALQSTLKRDVVTFRTSYQALPWLRWFGQAHYAHVEAVEPANQAAFNANIFGGTGAALGFRTDNPFLTDQARAVLTDPALNLLPANPFSPSWNSFGSAGAFGGCSAPGMPVEIAAGCPAPAPGTRQFYTSRYYTDILGAGESRTTTETAQFVFGFDGDFQIAGRDWAYDVSYAYGRAEAKNSSLSIAQAQFNAARDAVASNGTIVCRVNSGSTAEASAARFLFRYTNVPQAAGAAPLDPSSPAPPPGFVRRSVGDPLGATEAVLNACSPLNLFGDGASSSRARDYVSMPVITSNLNEQFVAELNLNGAIATLPAGDVRLAAGASHRRESSDFRAGNDAARFGLARTVAYADMVGKAFESTEYYGEVIVPALGEGFNLPGIHELTLNASWRGIDHSIAGEDEAWTYGLTWSPVEWLTLRANKTRSVRAPSLTELYLPASGTFSGGLDPCDQRFINAGAVPDIRRRNCATEAAALGFNRLPTFLSAASNAVVQGRFEGNPDLNNEQGDSQSVGFVMRSDAILGRMGLSVDYVRITLTDSIENFGLNQLFLACYDSPVFPNPACERIVRLSGSSARPFQIDFGSVNAPAFFGTFANAGYRKFEGITGSFDWSFGLNDAASRLGFGTSSTDLGQIGFRLVYSYIDRLEVDVTGTGSAIDLQDGEVGRPYNEHQLTTTYSRGPITLVWVWAHQGAAKYDQQAAVENRAESGVETYDLFHASILYDVTDEAQVRLIVNNLLDEEPPFYSGALNYDQVGRAFQFGVRLRF
jgi:outer membrane receptor protein involved in Fe transport